MFCLPNGDDLSKVEFIVVHLGYKNGRHSLVEGGPVHVDGGPHRQHKADDASVNVVVF